MTGSVEEPADGVLVLRHESLDLNTGLVLGDDRCLVVDTRSSDREAAELLAAVRRVTGLPLVVVNTHAHFDHVFGNAVLVGERPGTEIWAHPRVAELLADAPTRRRDAVEYLRAAQQPELAAETERVSIRPPDHAVEGETRLDLGGRAVLLRHPGRGHTDHDVVVEVGGAGVLFAGDLVEQGAPPAFDDAWVADWPVTMAGLLPLLPPVVVPGHGDLVGPEFVARQLEDLREVADAAAQLPPDAPEEQLEHVALRLSVGGPAGFSALRRAQQLRPGPPG